MRRILIFSIVSISLSTSAVAAQEPAEDPAVARSLEILQSIAETGENSDSKELVEEWIEALMQEFGSENPVILRSLDVAGRSFFDQGAYTKAATVFEQQVELSKRIYGPEDRQTLMALGWLAGMFRQAADNPQVWMIEEDILEDQRHILGSEHPDTLNAKANLAGTLYAQGDLAGARQLQEEVLASRRRILGAEHPDTLGLLNNLALTLYAQGDRLGAQEHQEEVLEIARRVFGPEHPHTLTALNNLASTLQAQGVGARQHYQEVLEIQYRVLGVEHPETMTTLANLAGTLYDQGDFAGARQRYEHVLEVRRRILGEGHPETATTWANLAGTLYAQGDLVGARQRFEQALKVFRRKLGDEHPKTLTALNNLAGILAAQGDLVGSRQRQEEVLKIWQRIFGDKHPGTLNAGSNLAQILYVQGDLDGARRRQQQILEILRHSLGDEHPDTLTVSTNLAGTLFTQGDLGGARQLQEEILEARRRTFGDEHPDTLTALANLAGTLQAQGDLAGARRRQEKVLEARRRVLGNEHPNTLLAMHNLGAILRDLGDFDEAQRLWEQVVESRSRLYGGETPDRIEDAETLYGLAEIHRDARRLEKASNFFYKALDALEGQADRFDLSEDVKSKFRTDKRVAYHSALDTSLRLKRDEAAFHTLERYRAQSLLMLLRWGQTLDAERVASESARDKLAQRSDELLYELNQIDAKIDRDRRFALLAERRQLQREKEKLWYQRMEGTREGTMLDALQVDETRPYLDSGTVLLAYHVTNDGTNLFVLTHDGPLETYRLSVTGVDLKWQIETRCLPRLLSLGDASAPESSEDDPEEGTESDDSDADIDVESWLYNHLLAPAERRLAAGQRILILPDGPLYYLPFAALKRDTHDDPRGWQYLVEWKSIHVVQSATVYAELHQRRPANEEKPWQPTLVALGNPSYPATTEGAQQRGKQRNAAHQTRPLRLVVDKDFFQSLEPLPKTAGEVLGIASLFPIGQARPLLGSEATEDRVKQELATAHYIHIAAHGFADSENSLDSFLALTIPPGPSNNRENGILEAWEVVDRLRLNADLVVLSACVTALGPELGGEGLMGLSRAFQVAGAQTVAASLWRVEDESTAELMIRFYRYLIEDDLPKDEALRAAQMELIRGPIKVTLADGTVEERDFSAPYHWAAFQLIGDWQ